MNSLTIIDQKIVYIHLYNQIENIKIDEKTNYLHIQEIQNEMMRDFKKKNARKWFKKGRVSRRTSSYINQTKITFKQNF